MKNRATRMLIALMIASILGLVANGGQGVPAAHADTSTPTPTPTDTINGQPGGDGGGH